MTQQQNMKLMQKLMKKLRRKMAFPESVSMLTSMEKTTMAQEQLEVAATVATTVTLAPATVLNHKQEEEEGEALKQEMSQF